MQFDDINIGGQIKVGTGCVPSIGEGDKKINGSAFAEGPVTFGYPTTFFNTEATLMVGPLINDDPDCETPYSSLGFSGNQPTAIKIRGNQYIHGDLYVTGSVDCLSTGRLEERHAQADASPKLFDMKHPSEEGMRLAHACIEGPEVGVYFRGRCRNAKEIFFPSYWKDLVHVDSISVQLQPIGAHQDIIIKRWDEEKIYLQAKGGFPIDCFYHVYGERKDVNPIVVEYEGESYEDRPDRDGDDPKYAGQNTWTR